MRAVLIRVAIALTITCIVCGNDPSRFDLTDLGTKADLKIAGPFVNCGIVAVPGSENVKVACVVQNAIQLLEDASSPLIVPGSPDVYITDAAFGDFDGDGATDIVLSVLSEELILYKGTGAGGFGSPTRVHSGLRASRVITADLDKDGRLDLICTQEGDTATKDLSILFGDGESFSKPMLVSAGLYPHRVAAFDLNGDGFPDLVTSDRLSHSLTILTNGCDRHFSVLETIPLSIAPEDIRVGDFDGDGKPDVVIAGLYSHCVAVCYGSGGGRALSPAYFQTINLPEHISVGDFDNDGVDDFLVSGLFGPESSLLFGNKNRSFREAKIDHPGAVTSTTFLSNKGQRQFYIGLRTPECIVSKIAFSNQYSADLALSKRAEVEKPKELPKRVCAPNEFITTSWTTAEGLPQNTIQCLLEAKSGDLFIGTMEGLAVFDGIKFSCYTRANSPSMANDCCLRLAEDESGAIWVGTKQGLLQFSKGEFRSFQHELNAPHEPVNALLCDKNGRVWIGSDGKLTCREPSGQFRTISGDFGAVLALAVDSDEHVWVGSDDGLLEVLKQLSPAVRRAGFHVQFSGTDTSALCPLNSSQVLFGFRGVLCQLSRDGGITESALGDTPVSPLCVTKEDNTTTVTSRVGVLYTIKTNEIAVLDRTSGMPEDARLHKIDREGNIWVGTYSSGLWRFRPKLFKTITKRDGLQSDDAWSVSKAHDGTMLVATPGGVSRIGKTGIKHLTQERAIFVAEDANEEIWFGGGVSGITPLSGRTHPPFPGSMARGILLGRNGDMWVPALNVVWRLHRTNVWDGFGSEAGLPGTTYIGAVESANGAMFVGSFNFGIWKFDGTRFSQTGPFASLRADVMAPVLSDQNGDLWIASERGLYLVRGERVSKFTVSEGLPDNIILDVVDDKIGWIWVNSYKGIWRVKKDDLISLADGATAQVCPIVYGLADGLVSLEGNGEHFPNSCMSDDGRLWFPTTKGVAVVDRRAVIDDIPRPIPRIEAVRVNAREIGNTTSEIQIASNQRGLLEVKYSAPSLTTAKGLRFKYRLLERDNTWRSDDASAGVASYSDLPPGTYHFLVDAIDHHNVHALVPAALTIHVRPHFHETAFFYLTVGGLTILLIAAAHVGRMRVVNRFNKLQRQAALDNERARIARDMHDDVGATVTRIRLLGELASQESADAKAVQEHVNKISRAASALARDMDEVVWAVNPKFDSLESLITYVGQFADELSSSGDLKCRVDAPLDPPSIELTSETRHSIFLAVKEALNNAVKHARATEIGVNIAVSAKDLSFEILDDGCGFDQTDVREKGNGLANIRQRMKKLRGFCDVQSSTEGTKITLKVPLK